MSEVIVVSCAHCSGTGSCSCKCCQDAAFGSNQNNYNFKAPCTVCGCAGKKVIYEKNFQSHDTVAFLFHI